MQHKTLRRLLSGFLAAAVAVNGLVISPLAENNTPVDFTKVSNKNVSASLGKRPFEEKEQTPAYGANDVVRVSIFLKDKSTIEAGFEVKDIAENVEAILYRDSLQAKQDAVVTEIEKVTKKDLDVVWNVTLAANLISANVEFGQIEKIEKLRDVKKVVIETQYQPDVVKKTLANDPNMSTSSAQIGSNVTWAAGYTGAGSRIAVIDTGTDDQHQSFNEEAYLYSLSKLAEKEGKTTDEFIKGLNLLTVDEIKSVEDQLNVIKAKDLKEFDAEEAYISAKLPFAFNYVDGNYDTSHENDEQGEHGSHVAGITTANACIKTASGFEPALTAVNTQGVAPDAQLITMKVFGTKGGAYDSDYMVAIEDAIILNADSVNLSLGSQNPGMSKHSNADYQAIMDSLVESGVVVSISAGNNGAWADESLIGGIYSDDVAYHSGGSPGSFTNALTVASIDNAGFTGKYLKVGNNIIFYTESSYKNEPISSLTGEEETIELEYVLIDGLGSAEEWAALGEGALEGKIAVCSRGSLNFSAKANNAVEAGAIATIIYNNTTGTMNMDLSDYKYSAPCICITQADGKLLKELATPVEAEPAAAANAEPDADETASDADETSSEAEDEALDANGIFEAAEEDTNDETPSEAEDEDAAEASDETADTDAEEEAPAEADDETAAPAEEDTQADEAKEVTYYVGTITVGSELTSAPSRDEFYTMSSFSSWGVPGSLTLKPEITAPGGNIYSINGSHKGEGENLGSHDQYENMSGTSMAAPQIAGMAAVAAQYVRKNGLADKTGVNERTLIQSLLMSTAEPVFESEGVYYSVLNQGAGLANIGNVVNADSYILMGADATDSYKDGKVKVELGDDPDKNGEYTFSFTVNNLTASEKTYDLSAILFTQAIEEDEYGDEYLSKITASLDSQAAFSGSGVSGNTVTVSANGSAEVTVTLTLTDSAKTALEDYVNGAYIEGYVFVTPSGANANNRVEHSIPVLGFYGNWSEPSMFDVGSYEKYLLTGEEERLPYLITVDSDGYIELDALMANAFTFTNPDDKKPYYLGGNPYDEDEEYIPERNAINGGNVLTAHYAAIRNAGDSRLAAYGEKGLLASADNGIIESAFYYTNGGRWMNTSDSFSSKSLLGGIADDTAITLAFEAAPEYYIDNSGNTAWDKLGKGAALTMPAVVDNTAPTVLSVEINKESNKLIVTVQDNQYVAAITLFDRTGSQVLAVDYADLDAEKGAKTVYEFNLDGIQGKKFMLQAYDYAMNTVTYEIKHQIGEDIELPEMLAYNSLRSLFGSLMGYNLSDGWAGLNENTEFIDLFLNNYLDCDTNFISATIVDHMVFAFTESKELYVMPEDDLTDMTKICDVLLTLNGETFPVQLQDLAYNYADGNIYAMLNGILLYVDKLTGELEIVGVLPFDYSLTLACDKEGNFYTNELGTGAVYKFTLDDIDDEGWIDPELICEYENFISDSLQAMEVNPNTGDLWWTAYGYDLVAEEYTAPLIKIDLDENDLTVVNEDLIFGLTALIIPEIGDTSYDFNDDGYVDERDAQALLDYRTGVIGEISYEENADFDGNEVIDSRDAYLLLKKLWYAPTKNVTGIQIDSEATITVGFSQKLTAVIQPWTASDQSITWTSSDESVATVDENGVVTAVSVGECTITAVSNANKSLSATCDITVVGVDVTLGGILTDSDEESKFFSWNMKAQETWTAGNKVPVNMLSATYDDVYDDVLYVKDFSGTLHLFDSTASIEYDNSDFMKVNDATTLFDDMAISYIYGYPVGIDGNSVGFYYLGRNKDTGEFELTAGYYNGLGLEAGATQFVAITNLGYIDLKNLGLPESVYADILALLDDAGNLYIFFLAEDGKLYSLEPENLNIDEAFAGVDGFPLCSMVTARDNSGRLTDNIFLSVYNAEEDSTRVYLITDPLGNDCAAGLIGDFGENIWPTSLLTASYNSAPAAAAVNTDVRPMAISEEAEAEGFDGTKIDVSNLKTNINVNEATAVRFASESNIMTANEVDFDINFAADAVKSAKKMIPLDIEALDINVSEIMAAKANASNAVTTAIDAREGEDDSTEAAEVNVEVKVIEKTTESFDIQLGATDSNNEPVDSVNGVAIVTYDPEALELADVKIDAEYTSANILAEEGVVILGYVNAEEVITAETLFETLTFNVKDIEKADGTMINIDVTELGDLDTHVNELIDLSSPLDGSAAEAMTVDSAVKIQVKEDPVPDEPDEPIITPPSSDTPSDDKIVLEDKDTGIKVEVDKNGVPSGAELDVDETGKDDNSVSVDISVVVDGVEVQPNGTMVVTIPVPDGLNGDDCHVYRVEADGTYTDMNAVYANGVLTFTTDRLGEFVVSTVKPGTTDPADTNKPAESDPAVNDPTGTNEPDVSIGGDGNNGGDTNEPGNNGGDNVPGTGVAFVIAPAAISALAVVAAKKHRK